jgi:hypothetical protein
MLKSIADLLKSVAVIVSFLIVIVLTSVVGKDLIWPTPTIESVSLPNAVQQWGYSTGSLRSNSPVARLHTSMLPSQDRPTTQGVTSMFRSPAYMMVTQ